MKPEQLVTDFSVVLGNGQDTRPRRNIGWEQGESSGGHGRSIWVVKRSGLLGGNSPAIARRARFGWTFHPLCRTEDRVHHGWKMFMWGILGDRGRGVKGSFGDRSSSAMRRSRGSRFRARNRAKVARSPSGAFPVFPSGEAAVASRRTGNFERISS